MRGAEDVRNRSRDSVRELRQKAAAVQNRINGAVGYCQSIIREPANTILVLISDLYEGGVEANLLRRAAELVASGVQFITLLALSDEGAPSYDRALAAKLAALGVPSFACTPDAFRA